jgi:hypothetical protein
MSKPFTCSFIAIPEQVLKSSVKPNAKLLYGVILSMYNCSKIVNCGNSYLGNSIGVGAKAAQEMINDLKEAGFIETSLRGRVRTIFPKIKTK